MRNKTNQYIYGFQIPNHFPNDRFFGNGEITVNDDTSSGDIMNMLFEFCKNDLKKSKPLYVFGDSDISFMFISLVNTKE